MSVFKSFEEEQVKAEEEKRRLEEEGKKKQEEQLKISSLNIAPEDKAKEVATKPHPL
ncbi:hypothetical protein A2U01_0065784, partial [Trifolium medium]|nr:hypothetical protein [Trifolium medium]